MAGGVTLPLKNSSVIEQASVRMLKNNGRSLKPLRKPNIPMGTVETSVNRETISKLSNCNADNSEPEDIDCSVKDLRITVIEDCEKGFTRPTIEEIPQSKSRSWNLNAPKPQCSTNREQDIKQVAAKSEPVPDTCAPVVTNNQTKPWLLHFPIGVKDGEFFEVIVEYLVPNQPKQVWVILATHEVECDKLLRDIHGQLNPNGELIPYDHIQPDDIYAAPFEDIYYRAVVLAKV